MHMISLKLRLEKVGILKEDTKSAYDGVNNPRLLTDKNTSSKTIRSAFTDDNMDWILDRIENPAQKNMVAMKRLRIVMVNMWSYPKGLLNIQLEKF